MLLPWIITLTSADPLAASSVAAVDTPLLHLSIPFWLSLGCAQSAEEEDMVRRALAGEAGAANALGGGPEQEPLSAAADRSTRGQDPSTVGGGEGGTGADASALPRSLASG